MTKATKPALPSVSRRLAQMGERLRLARLRRQFSAQTVAARARITRATLYRVEQGDPGVSMRNYASVLAVLQLDGDLDLVARDDVLGRRLQDLAIAPRRRAPRNSPAGSDSGGGS